MSLTAPLLALGLAAASAAPGSWAVLGVRVDGGVVVKDAVELVRGAAAHEVSAGGRVFDADETRSRLGLPSRTPREIRELVDTAELYYFQLELAPARRNLELALEALVQAGGDAESFERLRVARLLLAMVELADTRRPGGRERALAQLLPLAALRAVAAPSPQNYPKELVELFEQARREVAARPLGRLRAVCRPTACADGQVWIDAAPSGVPGEWIPLPAGTWRLRVSDRFEAPRARSLTRELVVSAGVDVTVELDLAAEGALDPDGGPAFRSPADPDARLGALRLAAARSGAERTVGVLRVAGPDGDRLHVAVLEGVSGRLVREASIRLGPGLPLSAAAARLARFAVSGEAREGVVQAGADAPDAGGAGTPTAAPADAVTPPAELSAHGTGITVAKWSSLGGAVLVGGLGLWFQKGASEESATLDASLRKWGGVVPTEEVDAVNQRLADIDAGEGRALGCFIGAGALAAGSAVLFWLDDDGD